MYNNLKHSNLKKSRYASNFTYLKNKLHCYQ